MSQRLIWKKQLLSFLSFFITLKLESKHAEKNWNSVMRLFRIISLFFFHMFSSRFGLLRENT